MRSRTERLRAAAQEKMEGHASEAKAIIDLSESENRDRTPDENEVIADHQKAIQTCKKNIDELDQEIANEKDIELISGKMGPSDPEGQTKNYPQPRRAENIGEQFVHSEQYKTAIDALQGKGIPEGFRTGPVEVDFRAKAGTLLEGAQGSGLIPVPQVIPGVTETLFQRLTVADLIPSGVTNTNSLRYVVEGTATDGAAGVGEGGAKPASDLTLSTVDEPVKKIATILTVSDEMLEDAGQVQSYINGRLSLFVKIEEERELVLGGGTNELVGITGRSGVNTYARGTVDNNAVALFKVLNGTRGSSFLEPDAIIMNPANWQTTRLYKDTNGQFYGGGPFTAAYGGANGGPVGNSGQIDGSMDSLWGKKVLVTTAIGSGTALVGSFSQASQLFRRGGLTVEATNSHASYFVNNLVAIRAEERLALAVYRPKAFTTVSGLE